MPFLAYNPVLSLSACVQASLYFYATASRSDFFLVRTCSAKNFTAFKLSLLFVIFSTFVGLKTPISASRRWRFSAQWQQLKKCVRHRLTFLSLHIHRKSNYIPPSDADTYIHNYQVQPISQDYWPSFSHGTYSLKSTPNDKFLRNLSWQFYLPSEFCQKSAERK